MTAARARSNSCSLLNSALLDSATTSMRLPSMTPTLTRSNPSAAASSPARAAAPSGSFAWPISAAWNRSRLAALTSCVGAARGVNATASAAAALSRSCIKPRVVSASGVRTARATAPSERAPACNGSEITLECSALRSVTAGTTTTGRARCTAALAAATSGGVRLLSGGHSAAVCMVPSPAPGTTTTPPATCVGLVTVRLKPTLNCRCGGGRHCDPSRRAYLRPLPMPGTGFPSVVDKMTTHNPCQERAWAGRRDSSRVIGNLGRTSAENGKNDP